VGPVLVLVLAGLVLVLVALIVGLVLVLVGPVLVNITAYISGLSYSCLFRPCRCYGQGITSLKVDSRCFFYMTFNWRRFTNECLTGEPLRILSLNFKCKSKVKPIGFQLLFSKNSVILSTAVMSQCMRNNHVLVRIRNSPTILETFCFIVRLINTLTYFTYFEPLA